MPKYKKEFEMLWDDLDNPEGGYYTKKQRIFNFLTRTIDDEKKEFIKTLERLKDDYKWGGDEDEDGGLSPGFVDFDKEIKLLK